MGKRGQQSRQTYRIRREAREPGYITEVNRQMRERHRIRKARMQGVIP